MSRTLRFTLPPSARDLRLELEPDFFDFRFSGILNFNLEEITSGGGVKSMPFDFGLESCAVEEVSIISSVSIVNCEVRFLQRNSDCLLRRFNPTPDERDCNCYLKLQAVINPSADIEHFSIRGDLDSFDVLVVVTSSVPPSSAPDPLSK